jgi:hypothetical protein
VYKHIACLTVSDISFERTRNSATSMGGKRRIVRQTLIFGRGHRTVPGLAAHPQMRLRPFLERPERLCDGPAKGSNRVLDAERCCLYDPSMERAFSLVSGRTRVQRICSFQLNRTGSQVTWTGG